jgi:hypothetical protein
MIFIFSILQVRPKTADDKGRYTTCFVYLVLLVNNLICSQQPVLLVNNFGKQLVLLENNVSKQLVLLVNNLNNFSKQRVLLVSNLGKQLILLVNNNN